jgi:flagellar motor switch/type III secretory pathway protein FliN
MNSLEQANRYSELPFVVEAEVGRVTLSMRDILALAPGSLLPLPMRAGLRIGVTVGDAPFASGEVVRVGTAPAVRLTKFAEKRND